MRAWIGVFLVAVVSASSAVRQHNLKRSIMFLPGERSVHLWSIEDTRHPLRCIVKCVIHEDCASVSVKTSSQRCYALSATPQRLTTPSSGNEAVVYTVRQKAPEHLEKTNAVQKRWDTRYCRNGKCLCRQNLMYSPSAMACIECSNLGDTFGRYPQFGIEKHNDKELVTTTFEECEEQCLIAKNFTCFSVEYINGLFTTGCNCYLSSSNFTSIPESEKSTHYAGWMFAVRECE